MGTNLWKVIQNLLTFKKENRKINSIQRETLKDLFFSYPSMQKIAIETKEEVFDVALKSVSEKDFNRVKEIADKEEIQTGEERDEVYCVFLLSLSDELKLEIEPDFFDHLTIDIPWEDHQSPTKQLEDNIFVFFVLYLPKNITEYKQISSK